MIRTYGKHKSRRSATAASSFAPDEVSSSASSTSSTSQKRPFRDTDYAAMIITDAAEVDMRLRDPSLSPDARRRRSAAADDTASVNYSSALSSPSPSKGSRRVQRMNSKPCKDSSGAPMHPVQLRRFATSSVVESLSTTSKTVQIHHHVDNNNTYDMPFPSTLSSTDATASSRQFVSVDYSSAPSPEEIPKKNNTLSERHNTNDIAPSSIATTSIKKTATYFGRTRYISITSMHIQFIIFLLKVFPCCRTFNG
jgi:hypothetical protein